MFPHEQFDHETRDTLRQICDEALSRLPVEEQTPKRKLLIVNTIAALALSGVGAGRLRIAALRAATAIIGDDVAPDNPERTSENSERGE